MPRSGDLSKLVEGLGLYDTVGVSRQIMVSRFQVYCIKMPHASDFLPDSIRRAKLCFLLWLRLHRIRKKNKWLTHARSLRAESRCVKMQQMITLLGVATGVARCGGRLEAAVILTEAGIRPLEPVEFICSPSWTVNHLSFQQDSRH